MADQEEPGLRAAAGTVRRVLPVHHAHPHGEHPPRPGPSGRTHPARASPGTPGADHRVHRHHPPAGRPTRTETFRLVTSLLDHHLAPAHQLARAYHQRWEIENGFAELKNRLRGAGFILRSKAPELIYQEIYALLTVYQALCALQTRAAEHGGTDPDRISFTVTVQLARLAVAAQAAADVTTLDTARREVTTELLAALLPPRRN
ncbi:transposase, partial [Streptomyces sp. NPDC048473]|uniref:transposase n=1 Tax=Streptomyces sp. NPDC048473 TaxID=3365556 RepID=UPI003713CEF9